MPRNTLPRVPPQLKIDAVVGTLGDMKAETSVLTI
jgi:hypothetical protein